jgi:hypothetical protein
MGAHDGGGGGAGRGGGGGGMQGGGMQGGGIGGGNAGRASPMSTRSESSPGRYADHDMGRMRAGEDHDRDHGRDHDRDRHDHDRFRFFPSFAFGFDTYSDGYVPGYGDDCWELHRVLIRGHWRLHRIWVCE